jgi:cell pole-organizing protein PopZ
MADQAKAGEQDQSMEEILQSIKRIIAEEGDVPAAETAAPAAAETPASFGSDVLELTDIIEEPKPIDPIDTIMAMTQAEPAPMPAPEPEAFVAPQFEPAPAVVPEPQPQPVAAPAPAMAPDVESLMSEVAVEASASALRSLAGSAHPVPPSSTGSAVNFRSGLTVEDLVIESLKPMLKEWLDENLPQIVERKVQREIERISRQA